MVGQSCCAIRGFVVDQTVRFFLSQGKFSSSFFLAPKSGYAFSKTTRCGVRRNGRNRNQKREEKNLKLYGPRSNQRLSHISYPGGGGAGARERDDEKGKGSVTRVKIPRDEPFFLEGAFPFIAPPPPTPSSSGGTRRLAETIDCYPGGRGGRWKRSKPASPPPNRRK